MAIKSAEFHLRPRLRRATTLHLLLALLVAGQIILYDAGKLIPPEVVMQRWIALGAYTIALTVIWYIARNRASSLITLKLLVAGLIVADLGLASFMLYSQRGMDSRAVVLYVFPIITAGILARRSAIIAAAILSATAYIVTAVTYFVINFNEGYKLELYGEVGFYAISFLIMASLIWVISRHEK